MSELPEAGRFPKPSRRATAVRNEKPVGTGRIAAQRDNWFSLAGNGTRPSTVFVGGSSRSVVNSVAFALAEMLDLAPLWLDVRDRSEAPTGPDPASTGWIPPDRLFVSENGRGLEPEAPLPDSALWAIVRSDEPASVLSHLTDFLHLPTLLQEIVSAAEPSGAPKALVVANSDRVAHLFPRTADGLQQYLRTLAAASISILAAHTGPSGPSRFGFKLVFRVDAPRPADWVRGTLVCEQGIDGGPFSVGRTNRLSDLPSVARVFRGLFPPTGRVS